jgi:single-strand DNA-binding protein
MINKVILLGNVGGEPEIRNLPSGGRVANFSLATSESWKDKSGERKEKTEWHKVSIFTDALVGVVEKYIKKCTKLYIEGSIRTRKYTDNTGVDRYATEIVIQSYNDTIKIIDSSPKTTGQSGYSSDNSSDNRSDASSSNSNNDDIDDDIPF